MRLLTSGSFIWTVDTWGCWQERASPRLLTSATVDTWTVDKLDCWQVDCWQVDCWQVDCWQAGVSLGLLTRGTVDKRASLRLLRSGTVEKWASPRLLTSWTVDKWTVLSGSVDKWVSPRLLTSGTVDKCEYHCVGLFACWIDDMQDYRYLGLLASWTVDIWDYPQIGLSTRRRQLWGIQTSDYLHILCQNVWFKNPKNLLKEHVWQH